MLNRCTLCPRSCLADRTQSSGFCGETSKIRIARAALHPWEEPCISGKNGSGTVFFSGCSLRCVFCQNSEVSLSRKGHEVSVEELTDTYFELARAGAHNINLVTPSHFTDAVAKSIYAAKSRGLELPFIWNSSGYELASTLKTLEGLVDVYLPDFKYMSSEYAAKYSAAPDYPARAAEALAEMKRQQPDDIFKDGLIKKGMIVRHLVLPGCTDDSLDVLDKIKSMFGRHQLVSVMSQYTPLGKNLPDELYRPLSRDEYEKVTSYAMLIGLVNGYFQEGDAVGESFIPDF